MSNRGFLILVSALIIGAFGFVAVKTKNTKPQPRLGISHPSQGGTHIKAGEKHPAYNSDPPSSGWHYNDASAPTPWGVYTQEVPDEVFLHNEEHGGIIITYRPDLPPSQIKKLQDLFAPPYSNYNFTPSKAIVTPRSKDTKPIELAAWTRTLSLDKYDENTLIQFYLTNVSKSPEATAGPNNTPINQARQ